jgi:hypothetical protein
MNSASLCSLGPEPVFVKVYRAQESIPINRLSQSMKSDGPVRQTEPVVENVEEARESIPRNRFR